MKNAPKPKTSVLVALVHELVKGEPFETLGELADAVKWRAARLRIPYAGLRVSEAIEAVAHTRPVVTSPPRCSETLRPREPEPPPISRDEAIEILSRLGVLR